MFLQALSIVSGLLLVSGIILVTNFTVAKNLANAELAYALQSMSSHALNDAETWAKETSELEVSEGVVPLAVGNGSSQIGCTDTTCRWMFIESWQITGGTLDGGSGQASVAANLNPGVQEGRVSIRVTTTVYRDLSAPLRVLASRSQLITARTLNVSPFFVTTAVQLLNANTISITNSEGDTAGVAKETEGLEDESLLPSTLHPSAYYTTVIRSQSQCINSIDAQSKNPLQDVPTRIDMPIIPVHNYVPTNESLVWIYEAPCNISFTPFDAPTSYREPINGEYQHEGSNNGFWINGNISLDKVIR